LIVLRCHFVEQSVATPIDAQMNGAKLAPERNYGLLARLAHNAM
jgi:hypothetical protein